MIIGTQIYSTELYKTRTPLKIVVLRTISGIESNVRTFKVYTGQISYDWRPLAGPNRAESFTAPN